MFSYGKISSFARGCRLRSRTEGRYGEDWNGHASEKVTRQKALKCLSATCMAHASIHFDRDHRNSRVSDSPEDTERGPRKSFLRSHRAHLMNFEAIWGKIKHLLEEAGKMKMHGAIVRGQIFINPRLRSASSVCLSDRGKIIFVERLAP